MCAKIRRLVGAWLHPDRVRVLGPIEDPRRFEMVVRMRLWGDVTGQVVGDPPTSCKEGSANCRLDLPTFPSGDTPANLERQPVDGSALRHMLQSRIPYIKYSEVVALKQEYVA